MSSRDMYRHLNFIQELVPVCNQLPYLVHTQMSSQEHARTHFQMETILFRASAMLEGGKRMVLGVRDGSLPIHVPSPRGSNPRKFSGTGGYSVYVANSAEEGRASDISSKPPNPDLCSSRNPASCITLCAGMVVCCWNKALGPLGSPPIRDSRHVRLGHRTRVCLISDICSFLSLNACPGRRLFVVLLATDMSGNLLSSDSMRIGRVGVARYQRMW